VIALHDGFTVGRSLRCRPAARSCDFCEAAHFRWPEASLRLLRRELDRLTWIFVPAALVVFFATRLDPLYGGWEIGRSAGLVVLGSLAFAFFRLMHPKRGVLAQFLRRREGKMLRRLYPLWYALLVAAPLALGTLSLLGFRYTAAILLKLLMETTWMALGLVLLNALAVRWLLVTRRHLVYQATIERQRASSEARQDEGHQRQIQRGGYRDRLSTR
jgi:small-conductance mechanosensitive channel